MVLGCLILLFVYYWLLIGVLWLLLFAFVVGLLLCWLMFAFLLFVAVWWLVLFIACLSVVFGLLFIWLFGVRLLVAPVSCCFLIYVLGVLVCLFALGLLFDLLLLILCLLPL